MFPLLQRWLKHGALEVQEYVYLTRSAFHGVFTRPIYRHDIVEQFDLIGAGSLTVVLLSGLFTGAALASQSGLTLDQFGARPIVGRLVSASMIKELGPVLTALMLTGRIGSGIAAELGSMVVTDQINALRSLGTDPVRKLVYWGISNPMPNTRLERHKGDPDAISRYVADQIARFEVGGGLENVVDRGRGY